MRVSSKLIPLWAFIVSGVALSQELRDMDRRNGREMLKQIHKDIEKHYYDPNFRGIDLEAHFRTGDEKIQAAESLGQVFGIIAQSLVDFNDSHTRFRPPSRAAKITYGWEMQAIGSNCYVTAVRPKSDAEAKGLKPGDQVLRFDQYQPTAENLPLLRYMYYALRPQGGVRLQVQSPAGAPRQIDVLAEVQQGYRVNDLTTEIGFADWLRDMQNESRRNRHVYIDSDEVFVWKMPAFNLDDQGVDTMMNKVGKAPNMVLDLRGNPGGAVKTLERVAGQFFEADVQISELKGREKMKPLMAKAAKKPFTGKMVVLVDSGSASSSEVLARLMQLEKRATVIGDKTAGKVMQSRNFSHTLGVGTVIPFGVSVTNADLTMSDGKSIEGVGVIPDEILLPAAEDLAAGRDPVLARAYEVLGFTLTAEKAGAMFPIEWED